MSSRLLTTPSLMRRIVAVCATSCTDRTAVSYTGTQRPACDCCARRHRGASASSSGRTVWAWGHNAFGQLGDGTTAPRPGADRHSGAGAGRRRRGPHGRGAAPTARCGPGAQPTGSSATAPPPTAPPRTRSAPPHWPSVAAGGAHGGGAHRRHAVGVGLQHSGSSATAPRPTATTPSRSAPTLTGRASPPAARRRGCAPTAPCGPGATTATGSSATAPRRTAQPGADRQRHDWSTSPPANTTPSRSAPTARCGPGAETPTGSSATAQQPTAPPDPDRYRHRGPPSARAPTTRRHRTDGTLWAWGDNSYGQLGDGTPSTAPPDRIGIGTTWTAISAGTFHTVALTHGACGRGATTATASSATVRRPTAKPDAHRDGERTVPRWRRATGARRDQQVRSANIT